MQPVKSEDFDNQSLKNESNKKCPCSTLQLAIIIIPITVVILFCAIFIPIYVKNHDCDKKEECDNILDESSSNSIDEFEEYIKDYTFATLTPKNGYDTIYIFLGGITEPSNKYLNFFKSKDTIIPKKTKIYFLSGEMRKIKFMENLNYFDPVPCWFNVDSIGNLVCDGCSDKFEEAKKSLNIVLDKIDEIATEEKMDYKKIFLGGFSQGGIMTNYVLLNSRHELGGYTAFSGYILDHNFNDNSVIPESSLTDTQKSILESKKDYHILATHSFNDKTVFYPNSVESYYTYYKYYTDFRLYSFGNLDHEFITQPVLPVVKTWLKEKMGK